MKELKSKITELRKMVFRKPFSNEYNQETEDLLKAEIQELMVLEPNKKELALFWNNEFTGRYDD